MRSNPEITVSFTGHRTYADQIREELTRLVEELYAAGRRRFLSGMAAGFDLAAAEAVLGCRERLEGLQLIAVVPFEGQQARFTPADRERFERVLEAADERLVLAPAFHRGCYAVRNDYLVREASLVVAWYDGSAGGTRDTVRRALRRGRTVLNLYPAVRLSVQPVQGELF
ncbi:SLOG family protein [Alistipes sp.]|uniref:SLOG family protein n=1 Tax=Alistipes sp. TaxID=1872444 RepID=UPI003AF0539F